MSWVDIRLQLLNGDIRAWNRAPGFGRSRVPYFTAGCFNLYGALRLNSDTQIICFPCFVMGPCNSILILILGDSDYWLFKGFSEVIIIISHRSQPRPQRVSRLGYSVRLCNCLQNLFTSSSHASGMNELKPSTNRPSARRL